MNIAEAQKNCDAETGSDAQGNSVPDLSDTVPVGHETLPHQKEGANTDTQDTVHNTQDAAQIVHDISDNQPNYGQHNIQGSSESVPTQHTNISDTDSPNNHPVHNTQDPAHLVHDIPDTQPKYGQHNVQDNSEDVQENSDTQPKYGQEDVHDIPDISEPLSQHINSEIKNSDIPNNQTLQTQQAFAEVNDSDMDIHINLTSPSTSVADKYMSDTLETFQDTQIPSSDAQISQYS